MIDLSHINKALEKQEANPVKGIIGADILIKGKAIIDYNKMEEESEMDNYNEMKDEQDKIN